MGPLYLAVYPQWCFTTDFCHHVSGRIIQGWEPDFFDVDIRGTSSQFIHCLITLKGINMSFFGTFIYGMSDRTDRLTLWEDLVTLSGTIQCPWVIMGDFHSIMTMEDRIGNPIIFSEIQPVRDCMASCELVEIKIEDDFPTAEATFLPGYTFDHCPMSNWDKMAQGCNMFKVVQKLKWIKADLKALNKARFSSVEATSIHQEFLQAQNNLHGDPTNSELATVKKLVGEKYKEAHANYLSFLNQTAKIQWLELGDENSKLFHMSIRHRKKQNKINPIHNEAGEWIQSTEGVLEDFTQFYSSLFCETMADMSHVNTIIVDQGPRITEARKGLLNCSFQEEDIKGVLNSILINKAPWLDGFNSMFFKAAWPVIKGEVCLDIIEFFLTGKILKEINVTYISLIPKVTVPAYVGDFRQ
ncbi:uncharacterized protein [Spinacia oleracea]|uniref:CRAL-TRIO domain-containing protein n=1 Tax=Spinacia oleracea TaxID=3562 RepID=A0ABM3QVS7_SPIOL|nr:uncharacterized protein LOC130462693 [Spinacia oleracea]